MKPNRNGGSGPALSSPCPEARKRAAAILEVMGGLSSPSSAAEAVGMSLPRYYALEKKALEGLVAACAPGPRQGRRASPAREAEQLRERVRTLERESSRNLALLRAAQRAAGLSFPSSRKGGKDVDKASVRKRRRKPVVRALVVAESLRDAPSGEPPPASSAV